MRLEERRLRKEGKYDEASALLGDAIASQNALELLLGGYQETTWGEAEGAAGKETAENGTGVS